MVSKPFLATGQYRPADEIGVGPVYCGDDCTSNCDATAECGEYADPPGKGCPLNVCCSEWGFCGSTAEFCNSNCQSNCELSPAIPPGKSSEPVLNKVIGYYEGWYVIPRPHKAALLASCVDWSVYPGRRGASVTRSHRALFRYKA